MTWEGRTRLEREVVVGSKDWFLLLRPGAGLGALSGAAGPTGTKTVGIAVALSPTK